MRVVCIDNNSILYENIFTLNKIYNIIKENNNIFSACQYSIIDDGGYKWAYIGFDNNFKPLSDIRNKKIDKLLGE